MNQLNPVQPSNGDYIGKLVKRFESGTKGCTTISQCGNDWGYSFGSYQLTARWGNALAFFRKYYGNKYAAQLAMIQYVGPDFASKQDPGPPYTINMNLLSQLWALEAAVDPTNMEINERKYIQENYYEKALRNLKTFNPNFYNRAFQECIWSWAVHKSGSGAAKAALSVLATVDLNIISAEELFDKFYDYRYSVNNFKRYAKGIPAGSSEREALRSYINEPPLVFNGINFTNQNTNIVVPTVTPPSNLYRIRTSWDNPSSQKGAYSNFETAKRVIDKLDGYYVFDKIGNKVYPVEEAKKINPYVVRVTVKTLNVRSSALAVDNSNIVGHVELGSVYTIVEESNGFGKLKSGAGWIALSCTEKVVKN